MVVDSIKNFLSSEFNEKNDKETAKILCEELFKKCGKKVLDYHYKDTPKYLVRRKEAMYNKLNSIQESIQHDIDMEIKLLKMVSPLKKCGLADNFGDTLKEVMQEKLKEMISVKKSSQT